MKSFRPRRSIVPVEEKEPVVRIPSVPGEREALKKPISVTEANKLAIDKALKAGLISVPEDSQSKNIQQTHIRVINNKLVLVNPTNVQVPSLPAYRKPLMPETFRKPLSVKKPESIIGLPPKQILLGGHKVNISDLFYEKVRKEIKLNDYLKENEVAMVELETVMPYMYYDEGLTEAAKIGTEGGVLMFNDENGGMLGLPFKLTATKGSVKFIELLNKAVDDDEKFIIGIHPDRMPVIDFMKRSMSEQLGLHFTGSSEAGHVPYAIFQDPSLGPAIEYIRPWGKNTEKFYTESKKHRTLMMMSKKGSGVIAFPAEKVGGEDIPNLQIARNFPNQQAMMDAFMRAARFSKTDIFGRPWDTQRNIDDFVKVFKASTPEELFKTARDNLGGSRHAGLKPLDYGWLIPGEAAYELSTNMGWGDMKGIRYYNVFVVENRQGVISMNLNLSGGFRTMQGALAKLAEIKKLYGAKNEE